MSLSDGLHDVPKGRIATVVTHLEMRVAPPVREAHAPAGVDVGQVEQPGVDWYRSLYSRVGADWLWFSRMQMAPATLSGIICHRDVEVFALTRAGRDEGLLELDFRRSGECELAFFGLTPALIGQGAGRYLMHVATGRAWARPIHRFWVHTCTLDHPGALTFYVRSGFTPYAQQVEVAPDPRLMGDLPPTAAPHVPIFRT